MCMTIKHHRREIKKLPREFTAYKVVVKKDGKFYPPIMRTNEEIKKHNVAEPQRRLEYTARGRAYVPYFHSFRTKAACRGVEALVAAGSCEKYHYLKIRIRRKDVTAVGGYGAKGKTQYLTIISKAYSTDHEEYYPQGQEA